MIPSPAVFRKKILSWYQRHGRHDLPWRARWDPYPILVSELMLQQTTVATVIPYFHRFLKKFPHVRDLANAPLESVLALWAGLGYYARARHLHRAAQQILATHRGRMPRTRAEMESLPGVGPYTAGAVLSFAYNQPEALVDGNVIRVLSRVYGVRDNTKSPPVLKHLWEMARALVPSGGARYFNSALMDLGATVCRPTAPDCAQCPLAGVCWANRKGRQAEIPAAGADPAKKKIHAHVAVIERDGRWFLRRRPPTGLYGGLWEFPGFEFLSAPSLRAVAGLFRERLGARPVGPRPLDALRHVLSHREIRVSPWVCAGELERTEGRWFSADQIRRGAVSTLTRRVWERVVHHHKTIRRAE